MWCLCVTCCVAPMECDTGLVEAGGCWREMERITDTEDRGQRPGEGRVHSTQPEHGGPASVGHMRQHSHSDGIMNPYLHRFYCTSQGLNRQQM